MQKNSALEEGETLDCIATEQNKLVKNERKIYECMIQRGISKIEKKTATQCRNNKILWMASMHFECGL